MDVFCAYPKHGPQDHAIGLASTHTVTCYNHFYQASCVAKWPKPKHHRDVQQFLGPRISIANPFRAIALHCPGASQCSNKVLAAMTVANISCAYQKYVRVVDTVAANKLSKHGA